MWCPSSYTPNCKQYQHQTIKVWDIIHTACRIEGWDDYWIHVGSIRWWKIKNRNLLRGGIERTAWGWLECGVLLTRIKLVRNTSACCFRGWNKVFSDNINGYVKLPHASSFVSFILHSIFHASHGKDTEISLFVWVWSLGYSLVPICRLVTNEAFVEWHVTRLQYLLLKFCVQWHIL